MRIDDVFPASPSIEDKLLDKHGVTMEEVAHVVETHVEVRALGRDQHGDIRYRAVAQTAGGRWLTVIFVLRGPRTAAVLSARDATDRERRSATGR